MGSAKKTTWILGAVFVAVLMATGAWFLLISPALDAASENRAQAENEQARIDMLEIELVALKADFENLDEYKAELADLQVQIPTALNMAELTRQVDAMAESSGVFVSSWTPSTSLPLSETLGAAEESAAATDAATGEAATDGDAAAEPTDETTAATAPASSVPSRFFAVPLDLKVVGSYSDTLSFLQQFQTGNPRLLLITGLNLERQPETAAENGQPALAAGDPATTIQAWAFVLQDNSAGTAADGEAPVVEELQVPSGQKNPFS